MRRILFVILGMIVFSSVSAQHNKQVTRAQLKLFRHSTTYVVMDNNPMIGYNIAIKASVQKFWKITPYKFITNDQFDSLRIDPQKSFLILTKVTLDKDKSGAQYLYLNLLMGDSVKSIDQMPEILELPLCYSGVDENSYVYKMGVIVRFVQNHVRTLMNARFLWTYRNMTYYNMDIRDIKKKTLLVERSDLSDEVNTLAKIKQIYPYDVRIVSSDKIADAVNNETPNTLIVQVINPPKDEPEGRSYKIIYGVDDGKMYYYDYKKISSEYPAGLLREDFERFAGN